MAIELLEIVNFRNLKHARLEPSPHTTLVIGKNGSGKTSLLESIHFLGTGRSFRTPHSQRLITLGESSFTLFGKLKNDHRQQTIGINKSKQQLKIKIDGQLATSASQLAERLPVQIINPDAHKLLEEGPRFRRRFMEWGVFHVEPKYFPLWQQCRHILKQRNAALKTRVSERELRHWDTALADKTETIAEIRDTYLEQLQPYVTRLLERVDGFPPISITLDPGWPKEKNLLDVLASAREQDMAKGFTTYGPHRLDIKIMVDGVRAKELVSRGQQKLLTAFLKIAQVNLLIESRPTANVVLLIDDLPAELDEGFRNTLLTEVRNLHVQSIITGTDLDLFKIPTGQQDSPAVFHVEHGNLTN
jgi:DNA replication and repair protein RecF